MSDAPKDTQPGTAHDDRPAVLARITSRLDGDRHHDVDTTWADALYIECAAELGLSCAELQWLLDDPASPKTQAHLALAVDRMIRDADRKRYNTPEVIGPSSSPTHDTSWAGSINPPDDRTHRFSLSHSAHRHDRRR